MFKVKYFDFEFSLVKGEICRTLEEAVELAKFYVFEVDYDLAIIYDAFGEEICRTIKEG